MIKQVVLGPITKDEQEVAETLYALAGMFAISGSNEVNELDSESLPKNSSVSQDQAESTNATFEVHLSERKKISSSSETIGVEQTDFPQSDNTAPKTNLQDVPMTVKTSEDDCKVESNNSKLCLEIGLNVSAQSQISHIGGKRDMENETVQATEYLERKTRELQKLDLPNETKWLQGMKEKELKHLGNGDANSHELQLVNLVHMHDLNVQYSGCFIIMAKPAGGPGRREQPAGMDEDLARTESSYGHVCIST
ncbi:hypothetical protein TSUD_346830 [Trifolium subterraneum]|nr:hypothetical protein TSUD_346830 [Trifolium subterraneum]